MSSALTAEALTPGASAAATARLSLNTMTTQSLSLAEAVDLAVASGLPALGLWRDKVEDFGVEETARRLRETGLRASSLCRGGFFTASDTAGISAAIDDNRRAIDEAATIGAPELVIVAGGLPDGDRDLLAARERVAERLADLVPYAAERGVRLALEPLHPMFVADRAVISTLEQALELSGPHDPADAWGSSSTPSTSSGTRAPRRWWREPGPRAGSAPTRSVTSTCPSPRARCCPEE